MYLLGASSIGSLLNWTIFGPIMLTLLFIGSTWFTEIITSKKYADYAAYKKDVWPIFPKFKR
jgi:steroid 5-alpha reductase family enzyme